MRNLKSKIIFSIIICSYSISYSEEFKHIKEIGFTQFNKKTEFISDKDIQSPKSAKFIKNELYINSLEGAKTIVYDMDSFIKTGVIEHKFENLDKFILKDEKKINLINQKNFFGKPVEFTYRNDLNQIFISYYRWSYDFNSSKNSGVAQIDIKNKEILNIIPTDSIPKIITYSNNKNILASTNWGSNTIGLYDLSNEKEKINYTEIIIGSKFKSISGDRDKNCGFCLRGSVFFNNDKYLLVGKMGGGGIAIIDIDNKEYLGDIIYTPLTPRHLTLSKDNKELFISTSFSGEVAKINTDLILKDIDLLKENKLKKINKGIFNVQINSWKSKKMNSGVRTISLSNDEKYIYAALNDSSEFAILNAKNLDIVYKYKIASFPVGLAVSEDDKYIALTSQGKDGRGGGNHVDIFKREK